MYVRLFVAWQRFVVAPSEGVVRSRASAVGFLATERYLGTKTSTTTEHTSDKSGESAPYSSEDRLVQLRKAEKLCVLVVVPHCIRLWKMACAGLTIYLTLYVYCFLVHAHTVLPCLLAFLSWLVMLLWKHHSQASIPSTEIFSTIFSHVNSEHVVKWHSR